MQDQQLPGTTTVENRPSPAPPVPPRPNMQKRRRSRWIKKVTNGVITGLILSAVAIALGWATWYFFMRPAPKFYLTAKITTIESLETTVYGSGSARAVQSEMLYVPVAGRVLEAYFYEGMPVRKGDVLCVIDSKTIDDAIDALYKSITQCGKDIEATESLIDKVNEDISRVNAEQIAQQKASVLALPFSGKMNNVSSYTVGEYITNGAALGLLYDDSKLIVRQYFSFGYENDIKVGMDSEVSFPAAMAQITGKVTHVEKIRNIQSDGTITFEVEVTIDNPGTLTEGMIAIATMTTASGETILPANHGTTEFYKKQFIYSGCSGRIKSFDAHNFYSYNEGHVILTVDFTPDDTAIEGFLQLIETHNATIESKMLQIESLFEQIREQELLYEQLTVVSPMDGMVLNPSLSAGDNVIAGNNICMVSEMGVILVDGQIEQAYYSKVYVGMEVDVSFYTDGGMVQTTGKMRSISMTPNNDYSGWVTYPCVIEIDNSDGRIQNGYYVYFNAIVNRAVNPLVVPMNAVKNTPMGLCLFIQSDTKVEGSLDEVNFPLPDGFYAVPVETGLSNYEFVQVISEYLTEGMVVFTDETDEDPSASPSEEPIYPGKG